MPQDLALTNCVFCSPDDALTLSAYVEMAGVCVPRAGCRRGALRAPGGLPESAEP